MLWTGLPIVFFAGMGVLALVRPGAIPRLFGDEARTAASRTEVRSVYGGFGLAAAAVLVWATQAPASEARGVFIALAIAFAGWAGGRVFGALVERDFRFFPTWFFVLEEVLLGLCLWMAARSTF